MRRAIVGLVAAAALLAGRTGLGQQTPPTGSGLIVGTVVDAATKRPVSGAVVVITGPGMSPPAVSVGQDGRFVFTDLPPGAFHLVAAKPGYLDSGPGQQSPTGVRRAVDLGDGGRLGDVVIRLWRHAVVHGSIVDDRGEPVVGCQVALLERVLAEGAWRLHERQTSRTDDRGAYRFAKVVPGRYVISAKQDPESFMESAMSAMAADLNSLMMMFAGAMAGGARMPEVDLRLRAIPTSFAPGVISAGDAEVLVIGAGEDRGGVNLRVARVPTYRVSGTVVGPDATPPNLSIQLTSPALLDQPVGLNLGGQGGPGGAGRFDFAAVPPGQYVLRVLAVPRNTGSAARGRGEAPSAPTAPAPAASTWWAVQPITITDRAELNLTVALREGVRMTGRVQFAGASASPPFERLSVFAAAVDSLGGARTNAPSGVGADGAFRTVGLPPGRYLLRLSGTVSPWRLKSVTADGRDVTEVPLEIDATGVDDVLITLTDRPLGSMGGTVRTSRGDPDPGAVVLVFPTDRRLWSNLGSTALRFKAGGVSPAGTYSISGLPEGDYFVLAGPEDLLAEWLQTSVLESLAARAARLQVGEGEKKVHDLTRNDR